MGEDPELPLATCLLTAEEAEPPRNHVEGILLEADLNLWASDGGAGKSGNSLHVAGSVINGLPAFGNPAFRVNKLGPVLYVSEEDGLGVIKNRMEALARGEGWDVEHTLSNFYTFAREGTSLDSEMWKAHLLNAIKELGVALVIFDPYSELTSANENSNTENKPIVRFFRQITNETGATVLVNHHLSKPSEGKRKLDRIRGFSALRDAARLVMFLERTDLGTSFECLKMSRAAPTSKFVVERRVITHPDNPAEWASARMIYLERTVADDRKAERLVISMLERRSKRNSTQLKKLAQGQGLSAVDMSKAIKNLKDKGTIWFEKGPNNSKLWSLSCLPSLPVVAGQPELPLKGGCPAPMEGKQQATSQQTLQATRRIE